MFVTESPIDLAALLREARPGDGALALFVGVVRNAHRGRATTAIEYQAYGPMAESEMAKIAEGVARDFPAVTLPAILGTILTLWAVANARAERAVPART